VRQQDAYRQTLGLQLCATPPRARPFQWQLSMPLYSLSKLLKLMATSSAGVYEKLAILDEYLVDHCWMLTCLITIGLLS